MEELQALNFLDYFSVITIGKDKVPNHVWKECQSEKLTEEQFLINLRKPTTEGIGINIKSKQETIIRPCIIEKY